MSVLRRHYRSPMNDPDFRILDGYRSHRNSQTYSIGDPSRHDTDDVGDRRNESDSNQNTSYS